MDRIKDTQKRSWEGLLYSAQRLDLLTVSISGAGIYVCLETIKYLRDSKLEIDCLIKLSSGLFLLAILANFISQIARNNSYSYEYRMCDKKLNNEVKFTEENKSKIIKLEELSKKADIITVIFNYISASLMVVGLSCIMAYFLYIF